MSESKQTIAKLLVAFADALISMDDRQFDLLIQGKAKLRLVEEQKNGKKPLVDSHLPKPSLNWCKNLTMPNREKLRLAC